MLKILETVMGLSLENEFVNDWPCLNENDDLLLLKNIYTVFYKYGHFDVINFLTEFANTLSESTGKIWRLISNDGVYKLSCKDDEICIYGKPDDIRMDINSLSSARYFVRQKGYNEFLFQTYERLYKLALAKNFDEICNSLLILQNKFEQVSMQDEEEITEIENGYKQKLNNKEISAKKFYLNGEKFGYDVLTEQLNNAMIKYEYEKIKAGFLSEYNPKQCITDCKKLLTKIEHKYYVVGLEKNGVVIRDAELLKKFGFNINTSNRKAEIIGSPKLYNKLKNLVDKLEIFLSNEEFSRENLVNGEHIFKMEEKDYQNQFAKLLNLLTECNKLVEEIKTEKADELYNQILINTKNKKCKIVLSKQQLYKYLYINELDSDAYDLLEYIVDLLQAIKEIISQKGENRAKIHYKLVKKMIFDAINQQTAAELLSVGNEELYKLKKQYEECYLANEIVDELIDAFDELSNKNSSICSGERSVHSSL